MGEGMGHAGGGGEEESPLECFIWEGLGRVSSGGEVGWEGTRPAAGPKQPPPPSPLRGSRPWNLAQVGSF